MPRLSAWFVRAALIYLAAGLTLGMLLLANKGVLFYPPTVAAAGHAHRVSAGRLDGTVGAGRRLLDSAALADAARRRAARLGGLRAAQPAGIWCVVLTPWLGLPASVLSLGRACEAAAAAAFALHAWPRVKPWVEDPA